MYISIIIFENTFICFLYILFSMFTILKQHRQWLMFNRHCVINVYYVLKSQLSIVSFTKKQHCSEFIILIVLEKYPFYRKKHPILFYYTKLQKTNTNNLKFLKEHLIPSSLQSEKLIIFGNTFFSHNLMIFRHLLRSSYALQVPKPINK